MPSEMIYIIATLTLKPGTRDKVIAAAKPCIAATRQEPGCLHYDLNVSVTDENQVVFVEQWKSRDDLGLHFERPHMKTWREAGGEYITNKSIEVIYPEKVEKL